MQNLGRTKKVKVTVEHEEEADLKKPEGGMKEGHSNKKTKKRNPLTSPGKSYTSKKGTQTGFIREITGRAKETARKQKEGAQRVQGTSGTRPSPKKRATQKVTFGITKQGRKTRLPPSKDITTRQGKGRDQRERASWMSLIERDNNYGSRGHRLKSKQTSFQA